MATWEEKIKTAAGSAFGGKLYQDQAPGDVVGNYAVFQMVGGSDFVTMSGAFGAVNIRVQFTLIAKRAADLATMAAALRSAMRVANTPATLVIKNNPLGPGMNLPAGDDEYRGRILEYSIWHDEALG